MRNCRAAQIGAPSKLQLPLVVTNRLSLLTDRLSLLAATKNEYRLVSLADRFVVLALGRGACRPGLRGDLFLAITGSRFAAFGFAPGTS